MSYYRVIPRDLFNEANLLKCLGQLYLKLEELNTPLVKLYTEDFEEEKGFEVQQNSSNGSLFVANILLEIKGEIYTIFRPLNSRHPWPVYIIYKDDYFKLFDDFGELSDDFVNILK